MTALRSKGCDSPQDLIPAARMADAQRGVRFVSSAAFPFLSLYPNEKRKILMSAAPLSKIYITKISINCQQPVH